MLQALQMEGGTASQGMQAAHLQRLQEEAQPVRLIQDLWPPGLSENECVGFYATQLPQETNSPPCKPTSP